MSVSEEFIAAMWFRPDLDDSPRYGEVRIIPRLRGTKSVSQYFIDLADGPGFTTERVNFYLDEVHSDSYFGVVPRLKPDGRAIYAAWPNTLWADIDFKNVAQQYALRKLAELPVEPNILVASGGGIHAYWLLGMSMNPDEASEVMVKIADLVGGDHVQDMSRVLRLPGTRNLKYPERPVARIIRFDTTYDYFPSDMAWALRFDESVQPHNTAFRKSELPPDAKKSLFADYDPGKGRRSEYVWRYVCDCIQWGISSADAFSFAMRCPEGVGAKLAEKSEAEAASYFMRTWNKAAKELL